MQKLKTAALIEILQAVFALIFIMIVTVFYLYSQLTDSPITIETIQALMILLLPYFGLDALNRLNRVKQNGSEE